MAKCEVKMPDDYLKKLKELGEVSVSMCKEAVYAGAAPVADQIRANAEKVLSGDETGEMMANFGITPADVDDRGVVNVRIGFGGYDSKGTANPLKANALESGRVRHIPKDKDDKRKHSKRTAAQWARAVESGTSTQKKRPFLRPAFRKMKKASIEAMQKKINEEIQKIMK